MNEERQIALENIIRDKLSSFESIVDVDKQIVTEVLTDIASLWEETDLSLNLAVKEGKYYILFKFKDTEGSICKGAYAVAMTEFKNSMYNLIDRIENGEKAVKTLNDALKKRQYEHGAPLNIAYKWNSSKQCSISDWDYNNIKIKLNDLSLDSLTAEYKKDTAGCNIENMVKELVWDGNIVSFVRDFNKFTLHSKLGITFGSSEIERILTENMLNTSDVLDIVRKQSRVSGIQKFKSVFKVNELGKFLVILLWNVDYVKKSITTSIMGDKALDIENNRFISDHNLFSRIESRATISKEIIDSVFMSND